MADLKVVGLRSYIFQCENRVADLTQKPRTQAGIKIPAIDSFTEQCLDYIKNGGNAKNRIEPGYERN